VILSPTSLVLAGLVVVAVLAVRISHQRGRVALGTVRTSHVFDSTAHTRESAASGRPSGRAEGYAA